MLNIRLCHVLTITFMLNIRLCHVLTITFMLNIGLCHVLTITFMLIAAELESGSTRAPITSLEVLAPILTSSIIILTLIDICRVQHKTTNKVLCPIIILSKKAQD